MGKQNVSSGDVERMAFLGDTHRVVITICMRSELKIDEQLKSVRN